MIATYHHAQSAELDSSHNTSSTSLVPALSSVPYPSAQHLAQVPSPVPLSQPAYELIQHRIFVGGFPSATNESELRTFFEKFGHIREAKVIRSTEGSSKGYGFVTFDTEEEAQNVRNLSPDQLEFKGRRLNLGPAMRRITHNARFTDFAVASPTPVLACNASPTYGSYYQTAYPQTPTYVLVQPNGQVPSFVYSPMTPPHVQHQLQQPTDPRYVAQNPSTPYAPPKQQQSLERANESVDENRSQSSPKQSVYQPPQQQQQQQQQTTLQVPQAYYAPQPMTPMTPSMQQQSFRHLQQMQNYVASPGNAYAHQPTMAYYATPNPTDMTHYSQMTACYYAPPTVAEQQQPQSHYYHEQEARSGQQHRSRSPRKSVVPLTAQMAQMQVHGSPCYRSNVQGYGGQQATTPTGVVRNGGVQVSLAGGGTAQLCDAAVVPESMLKQTPPTTPNSRAQQH
uniref:RRM domain-containing protein n=1 Tax=Plectus sambesii TaxID=2011161 RepID=A0A914ULR7_9BILA